MARFWSGIDDEKPVRVADVWSRARVTDTQVSLVNDTQVSLVNDTQVSLVCRPGM